MMLMAFTFLHNDAKAQNISVDSALTVTDSSITTPNNIVVTDSSGSTTLFAGGQQSDYAGKVGVGTNKPTDKLSVVDSLLPSISVSNTKLKYQFEIKHHSDKYVDGDLFIGFQRHDSSQINSKSTGSKSALRELGGGNERTCDECVSYSLPSTFISSAGSIYFEATGCDLVQKTALVICANNSTFNTDVFVNGAYVVNNRNGDEVFKVNTNDNITYAKEIKVQATPFPPDFVFNKDYKMMSLHELEQYVNANHHLPEIPSADEQKKDGVNVAEMQAKLLQKVEELTLIIIEQNKRIEELEKKK